MIIVSHRLDESLLTLVELSMMHRLRVSLVVMSMVLVAIRGLGDIDIFISVPLGRDRAYNLLMSILMMLNRLRNVSLLAVMVLLRLINVSVIVIM